MLVSELKKLVSNTRLEAPARALLGRRKRASTFETSGRYWEERYRNGGNSGVGSYGRLANFKAEVLNAFVTRFDIASVIEFGSGDGNQLSLARYPQYTGIDVSQTAVAACRSRFAGDLSKEFFMQSEYDGRQAALALSLDVIFHLIEEPVYEDYMARLFGSARQFVIIYASNEDKATHAPHVRHRRFTDWIAHNRPDFRQIDHIPNRFPFDAEDPGNTSFADFHIFGKNG